MSVTHTPRLFGPGGDRTASNAQAANPRNDSTPRPALTQAPQPQAIERKAPAEARSTVQMLPVLIDDAPRDFEALGGDFERMRKHYRCSRRRAMELVVLGLCRALKKGPERGGYGRRA